jgi:hypothetical protein
MKNKRGKRWVLGLSAVYLLVYILILYLRPLNNLPSIFGSLYYLIAFALFVPLILFEFKPKLLPSIPISFICLSLSYICLLLTLFNVPGSGWSWLSVGMMGCFIALDYELLSSPLSPGKALVLATSTSFSSPLPLSSGKALVLATSTSLLAMMLWEIPFRVLAYTTWGFKYWPAAPFLTEAMVQVIPTILVGLFILHFYHYLHPNRYTFIFLTLTVLAFTAWRLLGFWSDPIYNGSQIVHPSTTPYLQNSLWKGSKVLMQLTLLTLFLRK